MNLGEKLAATLAELEAANIKGAQQKADADLAAIRKEKEKWQDFLTATASKIKVSITSSKVPCIKESNHDRIKWLKAAQNGQRRGQAPVAHQNVWNDFVAILAADGLRIILNNGHDGVGIKSWLEITVEPIAVKAMIFGGRALE